MTSSRSFRARSRASRVGRDLVACLGCVVGSTLLVVGCTGGAPEPARRAELVAPADLPERQRLAWERWQAGGAEWELEREAVRRDPALARFTVDNLVVVLVRSYERSALARAGEQAGPFERAQAELVELADASMPVLVELLGVKDGIVAFLAADTLRKIGARAIAPTLVRLADPVVETRRRAAELLGSLPHAGADEPAILETVGSRAEQDEAWIVRAQAAQALGERGARHAHKGYSAAVLSRLLADPDPAVVASAARGLTALGEPRAIPALIRALERAANAGEVAALQAIQSTLRALSGEPRDKGLDGWSRWWTEHGASRIAPAAQPASPEPR